MPPWSAYRSEDLSGSAPQCWQPQWPTLGEIEGSVSGTLDPSEDWTDPIQVAGNGDAKALRERFWFIAIAFIARVKAVHWRVARQTTEQGDHNG
jgi:hypothetical protein